MDEVRNKIIKLIKTDQEVSWGTNLEQTLAAAVELHAQADAAGLTGAGELAEQSGQDGAGQCLLQQRGFTQVRCYTKSYTGVKLEQGTSVKTPKGEKLHVETLKVPSWLKDPEVSRMCYS